jgi:hypothetical protein
MENDCYFVNSRGLLKSTDIHSLSPKSSCNSDKQYLVDMIVNNKLKDGMSIYICSDLLKFFVNIILPKITHKFVLLSGDSDLCVPIEALNQSETAKLLYSPYLIKWFVQNTRIQDNPKIIQLPIGLDYHTISNYPNCSWRQAHEEMSPISQEKILKSIISECKPFYERIPKIYVNFSKDNDRFKQRENSVKIIPKELMVINNNFTPRTLNWKKMVEYTFILSPFGVGMDCHRTWEALCLGCIPIVCAPNFKSLFSDLPVLVLNNWNEINEILLEKTIDTFKQQKFNYEKLTLEYWISKIKN